MPDQIQRQVPLYNQESVWDYPRPPRLEVCHKHLRVIFNGIEIVNSHTSYRILETSHPPTYYISPDDLQLAYFHEVNQSSLCEWKGRASYYDITVHGKTAKQAAWFYKQPSAPYQEIANYVALYAHLMEACYVNDEKVQAQQGDFYGGWITADVVGPFKGAPGTWGW